MDRSTNRQNTRAGIKCRTVLMVQQWVGHCGHVAFRWAIVLTHHERLYAVRKCRKYGGETGIEGKDMICQLKMG